MRPYVDYNGKIIFSEKFKSELKTLFWESRKIAYLILGGKRSCFTHWIAFHTITWEEGNHIYPCICHNSHKALEVEGYKLVIQVASPEEWWPQSPQAKKTWQNSKLHARVHKIEFCTWGRAGSLVRSPLLYELRDLNYTRREWARA